MIDFDVAFDKLAGFETADQLADLFRDYGVKAVPSSARYCAISKWMKDQTGLNVITAGNIKVENWETGEYLETDEYLGVRRPLTKAMIDFMCQFDCNRYPDLVDIKILSTGIEYRGA